MKKDLNRPIITVLGIIIIILVVVLAYMWITIYRENKEFENRDIISNNKTGKNPPLPWDEEDSNNESEKMLEASKIKEIIQDKYSTIDHYIYELYDLDTLNNNQKLLIIKDYIKRKYSENKNDKYNFNTGVFKETFLEVAKYLFGEDIAILNNNIYDKDNNTIIITFDGNIYKQKENEVVLETPQLLYTKIVSFENDNDEYIIGLLKVYTGGVNEEAFNKFYTTYKDASLGTNEFLINTFNFKKTEEVISHVENNFDFLKDKLLITNYTLTKENDTYILKNISIKANNN